MALILPATTLRAVFGGALMGLANLVPGISGGTMLLVCGVYERFISAVAEVTTFKFRARSLLLLGTIVVAALVTIGVLAGVIKDLVVEHRWIMYSLFIGLTLGGVPVVWRMAKRLHAVLVFGFVLGFGAMVALAMTSSAGDKEGSFTVLLIAGIGGASAMILPGVSGAYLLLILGQYERILESARAAFKGALSFDFAAIQGELGVVIPVALGVVIGVVGVSNAVKWMLEKHAMLTYGLLLGLLLGSVIGIYPFQQPVSEESRELVRFAPTGMQIAIAVGLAVVGFVVTTLIDRVGNAPATEQPASA